MKQGLFTFDMFEEKCQHMFDKYESQYFLSDLRIWREVPGSMEDGDVWYCIINKRNGVNMIMKYDHSGEFDDAFEVLVDWGRKTLNRPCSQPDPTSPNGSGYTTSIGTFYTFQSAFVSMLEEPSPFRLSIRNDGYCVGYVPNAEEKKRGLGGMIDLETLSFLECLDKIQSFRDDPNSEWKGRIMTIIHKDAIFEEIYKTQL